MSYITTADVTDSVAKAFISASDARVATWLSKVDNEIKRLALSQGLLAEDILEPLNPIVKEYAINYFCLCCFFDNIGSNNVSVAADEKYRIKYDAYVAECNRLRQFCTKNMLTTDEDDVAPVEMTTTKNIVRG